MSTPSVQSLIGLQFERRSGAAQLSLGLALAALWLLGRRYAGIVHDATVYAVQGLRKLEPGLANDLFFSHGAQDAYTVFPALYASLISAFGTAAAAIIVTLAGQAAFLQRRPRPSPGGWSRRRRAGGRLRCWPSCPASMAASAYSGWPSHSPPRARSRNRW